ncbi:MAG: GTP-binding protein TypA/BipA [Alphaproteobacteria bacterium ADurb.Bin438]|nr:MAG: GTP-binding protein TypA/BipA [Alphaproteobacteria bacterium ADurb.Bin438]
MKMRNIAIIAHVDHGKTTLVDAMLKQSGTFRENQVVQERIMDSNDIERERGITILAKATSVEWHGARINIVDTPGHADFGGEVERILNMVDGAIVLVDAAEGPLPQTKFVLSKALKLGLRPIVVINKVDRPDARVEEVLNEMFDLFVMLDANDEQLDFPVLYACGREGWAVENLEKDEQKDLTPLFNVVMNHVPAPLCFPEAPFSMLVTTLEMDPFVGRILTGKIYSGQIKLNSTMKAISMDGTVIENARVSKIMAFRGVQRTAIDFAYAGDIVSIAGFKEATVADTLCDVNVMKAIKAEPIDPPTLAMTFSVNDSPYAGKDGSKVTSRMIGERLMKEAEGNVALKIKATEQSDAFEVAGRGELQLGILIETMRREGFELSISRPRVLIKEENGKRLEPYEDVVIDVDDAFTGNVAEKMGIRRAQMTDMRPIGGGKTRMTFKAPSRGLIGYHSEFLTDTSGTGIMNRIFSHYGEFLGEISGRRNGVLISIETGVGVPYALEKIQERGELFITGGDAVYEGMIIGENAKSGDLEVNPIKSKQLTNFRASGKDDATVLVPPRKITLEQAMSYIEEDELVEVTPNHIRLRKRHLDPHERKRASRAAE